MHIENPKSAQSFGQYLKEKRMERGRLKDVYGTRLDQSMCVALENGRRKTPLKKQTLDELADVVGLEGRDRETLFDLAAIDRGNPVPADITLPREKVVMLNELVRLMHDGLHVVLIHTKDGHMDLSY